MLSRNGYVVDDNSKTKRQRAWHVPTQQELDELESSSADDYNWSLLTFSLIHFQSMLRVRYIFILFNCIISSLCNHLSNTFTFKVNWFFNYLWSQSFLMLLTLHSWLDNSWYFTIHKATNLLDFTLKLIGSLFKLAKIAAVLSQKGSLVLVVRYWYTFATLIFQKSLAV